MAKSWFGLLAGAAGLVLLAGCQGGRVVNEELGARGDDTLPVFTPNMTRLDLAQHEFIPYRDAFVRRPDGSIELKLPALPGKPGWTLHSLGPVPVKPATHYRLEIAAAKNHTVDWSWYLEYGRKDSPAPHGSLLWRESGPGSSSGYTQSWELLTPSDATELKLWIALTERNKPPTPGTKAIFQPMRLVELEQPKLQPRETVLMPWQLADQPDGKAVIAPEYGSFSNIEPTVATVDGVKVLQFEFTPKKSLYAFLISEPFECDGALIRYRFEVRGSGWMRPGIWWKRTPVDYFYSHSYPVALTEEWRTVELEQGCVDPLAKQFAVAFTNAGGDMTAEVRNIEVGIRRPVDNRK